MVEVKQVIEIRDPEINVEEIMNRIRERIRQRREQAQREGLDYDRLVEGDLPHTVGKLPGDLYYELHQACTTADAIGVSLAMRDRRFPVLNSLLFRVENLLHQLVVKYVNQLAGHQITFNRSTAQVLSGYARALEERETRLESLEQQVKELGEKLSRMQG